MISVLSLVSMNNKPAMTSKNRSMMESFKKRKPCNPEDRAMTPIDEVRTARIVSKRGVSAAEPSSKIGLSRKKKGRMNPVSPSLTAIKLVLVWSESAIPLAT